MTDLNEPYGRLSDTYTPLGYHTHISYDSYGEPTLLQGDSFIQKDLTSRYPVQAFQYDSKGNLVAYTKLGSSIVTAGSSRNAWILTYDGQNRLTSAADPDGYVSYTSYDADGSVAAQQDPYQHALGTWNTTTYDADGNLTKTTAVTGGKYASGGTPDLSAAAAISVSKYYDGDDRLVEVLQSHDPTQDVYDGAWITRYIYDLSQSANPGAPTISIGTQAVVAYGGLYKTQEYLPTNAGALTATYSMGHPPSAQTRTTFYDIKGDALDALGRATKKYFYTRLGGSEVLEHDTDTYDDPTAFGLLHSHCNPIGQCSTDTYNALGQATGTTFNDANTPNTTTSYDPNGRVASVTSATYGTQTYLYDSAGRTTTSIEPLGFNGWTGATLSYSYYPDGRRSAVDVTSSGFTQTGLLNYSYRTDGSPSTELINVPSNTLVGQTTLSFSYSPAGRLRGRSEAGAGANASAIQVSYDAYGQAQQITYPGGTYGSREYDASGLVLGETFGSAVRSISYTARGDGASDTDLPGTQSYFANGTALTASNSTTVPSQSPPTFTTAWEPKMGVVLSTTSNPASLVTNDTEFMFDAAGRDTTETSSTNNDNNDTGTDTSASRTYDALDHLVSQTTVGSDGSTSRQAYLWGPNGHPAQVGSSASWTSGSPMPISYENLHWDGSQILFTTNASGQLDDIKIGALGDVTPLDPTYKGLTFYDRDLGGAVGYCHNAAGAGGFGQSDPRLFSRKFSQISAILMRPNPCGLVGFPSSISWGEDSLASGASSNVGRGGLIGMPRTDGISDGLNTIQGVRAYDPELGAWTTPDAYAGDLSDPMSQKSYIWNGNNAIKYSDPTGYYDMFKPLQDAFEGWGHSSSQEPDDSAREISALIAQVDPKEDPLDPRDPLEPPDNDPNAPTYQDMMNGFGLWEGGEARATQKYNQHPREIPGVESLHDYNNAAMERLEDAESPQASKSLVIKQVDVVGPPGTSKYYVYDPNDQSLLIVENNRASNLYKLTGGMKSFNALAGKRIPYIPTANPT
jgi:YD repeat-containing protein